jgi:endoglucanase Acf2
MDHCKITLLNSHNSNPMRYIILRYKNNPIKYLLILWLSIFLKFPNYAQEVLVGSGSYNQTFPVAPYPVPYTATGNYQRAGDDFYRTGTRAPKVTAGWTGPIPTNEWWSSAIWNFETATNWLIAPYSFNMFPHPLSIGASRYGLKITAENDPVISATDFIYYRESHLYVGVAGMDIPATTGTKVSGYGDWSVTMNWNDGAGKQLNATSGHGLPFVYFTKSAGSDVTLRYEIPPVVFSNQTVGTVQARGITFTLGATTAHYGIFVPVGSTYGATYALQYNEANVPAENAGLCCVNRDANNITLPAGQNYFSIALLPDNNPATLAYYAQHAFAFVTDTKVSWAYNPASSSVTSTFTTTTVPQGTSTETRPLMALYRHQWLNTSNTLTAYTYPSARGQMKVFEGTSFSTTTTYNGILPSMPNAGNYNKPTLYNYVNTEYTTKTEIQHLPKPADTYTAGKQLGRVAELVHIAHQVGHYAARDAFRTYIKNYLQDWLKAPLGEKSTMFHYDNAWTTLVGLPASYDSDRQLNDHHFHYGYFIKAAATVAEFESNNAWTTQWGPMVEMLIKDVANWDRTNTMFPFLRNLDPYAGHSWASGHANFQKGNNQESSSEALNFASAVVLWGANTGNNTIRDLGIFMYTTENLATRQYWFDENNVVFPATFSKNSTGILWGWGNEYTTWFSGDPEHIQGINILPLTGGSLYMGLNPAYVTSYYNEMKTNNGGPETAAAGWQDIWWNYVALSNSAYSKTQFAANAATYIPFDGETKAHTYHWISNLDSMGTVDATVLSTNTPTYSVFVKNSCKHYVIYNPPFQPAFTAQFSDGKSFAIPADTLIVFRVCPSLPVELLNFQATAINNKYTSVKWETASELNNDFFEILRCVDLNKNIWETIGRANGKGNSNAIGTYEFLDQTPYPGINYYKLKQMDVNGQFTYSKSIAVEFTDKLRILNIYPNPSRSDLHLEISSLLEETVYLNVYDMLGRKVIQNKIEIHTGINGIDIDVSAFAQSNYVLQLINSLEVIDIKFIKE